MLLGNRPSASIFGPGLLWIGAQVLDDLPRKQNVEARLELLVDVLK